VTAFEAPRLSLAVRVASELYEPESAWYLLRTDLIGLFGAEAFARVPGAKQYELARRGDVLGLEGDPGELAYVVRSGRVSLSRLVEDERRSAIAVLTVGGPFGEAGLPGKSAPREHVAEALEPSTVVSMPAGSLRAMIASRPDYALTVTPKRGPTLSRPLERLIFKDVRTRIVEALAELAEAREGGAAEEMDLGIGAPELADLIGAGRQVVNTLVNEFKHEGHLSLAGGTIRVGDPEKLRLLI
jgi:CRP/FNR family cyclic AMP-dependent transcriptional regulator